MAWELYEGDHLEIMPKHIADESIDLTVTSPPYDDLREYKGYKFDYKKLAKELYRVTKPGGVVVWVVGDATINGSETGTSFRQALHFMEIGFNLHDTMIYHRKSPFPGNIRYFQAFEYMFVLSKGKPRTFNPLKQLKSKKSFGKNPSTYTYRDKNGGITKTDEAAQNRLALANDRQERDRDNIWYYGTGYMVSSPDKMSFEHPAIFPEKLARDHIVSWSNPGDTILDPMAGSGTVLKVAEQLGRNSIGIEISGEYCDIIRKRLDKLQMTIFNF